jgi:hypothetical protein
MTAIPWFHAVRGGHLRGRHGAQTEVDVRQIGFQQLHRLPRQPWRRVCREHDLEPRYDVIATPVTS